MSYFRLILSRSFKETKRIWNVHRLWMFVSVPISGFILRVLVKGKSQFSGLKELVLFACFGLIVSWLGTYLISLIRVPGEVHREQLKEISALREKIVDLEQKRKLSLADQHNYERAKSALGGLPEKDKAIEVLRDLRNRGNITFGHFPPTVPPGMRYEDYEKICWKCEKAGLLIGDISNPGHKTYSIAPGMRTSLEKLLFGDE